MRVLYIVGQAAGGLPHYTAELANAMTSHADVTVLKPDTTTADDLFDDEVDVRDVFEPLNVSMPKLYRLQLNPVDIVRGILSYDGLEVIADIDPDIVHDTTGLFPNVRAFLKRHGIDESYPFVSTRHEVPVQSVPLSRPAVLAERLVNALIPPIDEDRTIVHTDKQKQAILRRGKHPEEVAVIPHGSYSVFGTHEDAAQEPEENCLLFFGNIIPPKGLDTLVTAIPLVKEEFPDVTLVVAGNGQISDAAWGTIGRHDENFEIHNYFVPNEEVRDLFGRAQLVVMPYRFQGGTKGHSGTLATAYQFGTPVVASTAGEFYSMVHRTGCGTVVPPGDPQRLAAAIRRILGDESRRAEMRHNCLQMADRLSWSNVANRHLAVYRDVLNGDGETGGSARIGYVLPGAW